MKRVSPNHFRPCDLNTSSSGAAIVSPFPTTSQAHCHFPSEGNIPTRPPNTSSRTQYHPPSNGKHCAAHPSGGNTRPSSRQLPLPFEGRLQLQPLEADQAERENMHGPSRNLGEDEGDLLLERVEFELLQKFHTRFNLGGIRLGVVRPVCVDDLQVNDEVVEEYGDDLPRHDFEEDEEIEEQLEIQ